MKTNSLTQNFNKSKNVYFDSSTERFGFNQLVKTTLDQTPGPGAYDLSIGINASKPMNKTGYNFKKDGFTTTERKFNPAFSSYVRKVQTNESIGPGSYFNPDTGSMVKKSYNMALEGTASFV